MRYPSFCKSAATLGFCCAVSGVAQADILTFDFTGRLTIAGLVDYGGGVQQFDIIAYQPISASLSYDTASGVGSSGLSMTTDTLFFGAPMQFHDITMTHRPGTNLIDGQVLVDWNLTQDIQVLVEWDATGLMNAIDYGLQVGDKLSGTNLYRDANGDQMWDASEWVADIGSATPHADVLMQMEGYGPYTLQGPAPLAATSGSPGITDPTSPFYGVYGFFDIGSGNSMYVTSVTAVPVPAAVWLFGSGLLGLFGMVGRSRG